MVITFELTAAHVALARRMCVHWNDEAYDGAPCIGIKRPYGNSDVEGDIYEITTGKRWDYDAHSDLGIEEADFALYEQLMRLHREMDRALEVILVAGSFEPGTYRADNRWTRDWYRVES